MTTAVYRYSTTLIVTSCGHCGIPFAIPDDLYRMRQQDGKNFYCPNGHLIGWADQKEMDRLKAELKRTADREAAARARADQAEASRRAWKGQATKLRNRAVVGQCPFCGEHVYQLARHVSRKHVEEVVANPEQEPKEGVTS